MSDRFESLLGLICIVALCAMIWVLGIKWGSAMGERGIIQTCNNYGSFVYQDMRYTCEKVVK